MNDLTKNDLIHLHYSALKCAIEFDDRNLKDVAEDFKKLIQKLQALIDTYCEHENVWGCCTCRTFICENEKCDSRNKIK